jgi:hypothetical protein
MARMELKACENETRNVSWWSNDEMEIGEAKRCWKRAKGVVKQKYAVMLAWKSGAR